MLKYQASPLTATFEHDGTRIEFAVPNEKELLAFGASMHSIIGDALTATEDGTPTIDFSKMSGEQLERFFIDEIAFVARRITKIEGLKCDSDPSKWSVAERIDFLSWLDSEVPAFGDFVRKLTTQKKRTSATGSPSSGKTSGTKANAPIAKLHPTKKMN